MNRPAIMPMRLLTLLLLTASSTLSAQPLDFAVKWGDEFKAPRKSSLEDIIGHDAGGIYAIKVRAAIFSGSSYTLERYDNNFRPVRSRDLEFREDGEPAVIQHILHLKNKLYKFMYYATGRQTRVSCMYVKSTRAPLSRRS